MKVALTKQTVWFTPQHGRSVEPFPSPRRKHSRLVGYVSLVLVLMLGLAASAEAQNFPSRLVRFIVPFLRVAALIWSFARRLRS